MAKSSPAPGQVVLQQVGTTKTKSFDADHAETLLNYPGSRWERVGAAAPADSEPATAGGQPIQE